MKKNAFEIKFIKVLETKCAAWLEDFYFAIQNSYVFQIENKNTFHNVDLKASKTGQVHTKNFISHFWATSAVCCWFMLVIIFKSWCWYTVGFLGLLWWHKIVSRCSERYAKGSRKYQIRFLVYSNVLKYFMLTIGGGLLMDIKGKFSWTK